ncbi:uncharacterized protein HKW66_Vig0103690 [Vigna angularis]|uniref:Uncharacterized protein n=1 Tax=Phaseolus angularis TaxID=3914 RepID=A0A8T0KKJ0_PHAAN|nr:uncharacterized protein HKW66_Vig0103690 [Vigna angularis]
MSMDDPAEMMRVLQQKMDEMQQRHEEEMAAVKADCEARIAREMGRLDKGERVKDKGKGVEGERPPPDTEGDKTWRPSGSEAEESKDRLPYQTPSRRVFQREQLSAWLGDIVKGSSALPNSKPASVPTRTTLGLVGRHRKRIVRPTKLQAGECSNENNSRLGGATS